MMTRLCRGLSMACVAAALVGCGGGGGGDTPSTPLSPALSGTLVDLGTSGLAYSTPTLSGNTGAAGSYTYRCGIACETITFKIGGITLGTATGAASLSMREFEGGIEGGVLSDTTLRRVQLLMALDADADVSNGIAIPSGLATSLSSRSLDFAASSFDADLASLIDFLRSDNRLSTSYRGNLQIPTKTTARAIAEQTEATARGVFVESPSSAAVAVDEIRKYVLRFPDSMLTPYTGPSTLLSTVFPRGLRPSVGAGLSVSTGGSTGTVQLRTVTTRGVAVPAPRYVDGATVRNADVLVAQGTNGTPSVGTLTLTATAADMVSLTSLKAADGTGYSGRPTPTDSSGSDGARNLDEALQPRSPEFDQRGLDPAGVTDGDAGSLWICDRRGPFLIQVDAQGRSLQRLGPTGNAGALPEVSRRLPAITEARQPGLGCGGVALRPSSGEVIFALGAALNINGRTANSARLLRIVGLNPRTNVVRQFGMAIRSNEFGLRVLDLETLSEDRVLALVRYRDGSAIGEQRWEIRTLDLSVATELSSRSLTNGPNSGLALEFGSAAEITASGVTLASSSTLVELGALGWIAETVEGLARVDPRTLVVIGQSNGGVTSRVRNGDAALSVAEHQVDRNGLISPRAAGSSSAPVFELLPAGIEARQTVLWTLRLRSPLS